jgi:hypothetical protein
LSHSSSPLQLFFCSTWAWIQGLHLEPLCQSFYVIGFLKIGSHKLFPWTGFEPNLDLLDLCHPSS